MELIAHRFSDFFREVYGKDPFPWQQELARRALDGAWPNTVALPTASGKTALIDIAVYALAAGAPKAGRRIFFVVDRRVVVDEAAERARWLKEKLEEHAALETTAGEVSRRLLALAGPGASVPLIAATLRGGIVQDDSWTDSPLQPAVCCTTVDQLGSSILFRAYGSRSNYNWPIRAALAAHDALILVDEAHTAQPFLETLERIALYSGAEWTENAQAVGGTVSIVEMSATPRLNTEVFRETKSDWSDPTLKERWRAPKPTTLMVAAVDGETGAEEGDFSGLAKEMVRMAIRMRSNGAKVIGIIVNRVRTARSIFNELDSDPDCEAVLMTGRSRPFARASEWERIRSSIELGRQSDPDQPVYVVATQCIEVGANVDFDALVTEAASIDALEQRFGRLNRDGRQIQAEAVIVAQKDQTASKYVDAVYGQSLTQTWQWLNKHAKCVTRALEGTRKKRKELVIDMGISALREILTQDDRAALAMPRTSAPVLLPAHVDRLSETAPVPAVEPEVALFLHGPQSGPADVMVVWRENLREDNPGAWKQIVSQVPPRPEEAVSIPVWAVRKWLDHENDAPEMADVEGLAETRERAPAVKGGGRRVLVWRGPEETEDPIPGNEVRPGMTLVAPASYGGCDKWGWNPESEMVEDLADQANVQRGTPTLRLDDALVRHWARDNERMAEVAELVQDLRNAGTKKAVEFALDRLCASDWAVAWVTEAARGLRKARRLRIFRGAEDEDGFSEVVALSASAGIEQESITASYAGEVSLERHLKDCERKAQEYAEALGLAPKLAAAVRMAARLHDAGKADQRFQSWLRGGAPAPSTALLAKSGANGHDHATIRRARIRAGYPEGARHELQSVALLTSGFEPEEEVDLDLLLHLVAAHHGRCRPFAPAAQDSEPAQVRFEGLEASSSHRLGSVGSGISERFWRLTRRYGWWGLAYLETIVRLADHRASEQEEHEPEEAAYVAAS